MKSFTFGLLGFLCYFSGFSQVFINELDCDTPSVDDKEFVELKSNSPNFSLDGYVLVFFNGSTSSSTGLKSYYAIDLDGLSTDLNGIITIGNEFVSPVPARIFSNNIVQNGPDAVAVYLGNSSDFPDQTPATTTNLVSALAYGTNDPDAAELMALLGLTVQYDEDANNLVTTQSIQRKSDGTYETKIPTPGMNNDGSGTILNAVQMSPNFAYEVAEGATFSVTFTTASPVTAPLNFSISLVGSGITASDYSGTVSLTIPTGGSGVATVITLTDDNLDEGDETFRIRFGTLPAEFVRANDNVPGIIIDNDWTTAAYGTPMNPTYGLVAANIPTGYYDSLEGKSGSELRQAIQDIIADPALVRAQNYGDIEYMLQQADQNPANSNQVWLMYVEQGRGKYKFQSTASNVGSWNREHVFPVSRGGYTDGTSSQPDGIDIWLATGPDDILAAHADGHHIRAEDGPENSSRNNRDYGLDYNGPTGNQGSWKGDVARALFYMGVRYNGLSLVDGNPSDISGNKIMGDLASLLSWNTGDPADDFEMNHNNVIHQWQLNRNPFVDYPALADYVYGSRQDEAWFANLSDPDNRAMKISLYPNPAGNEFWVSGIASGKVEIFSMNGLKVAQSEISASRSMRFDLPVGIYVARVSSDAKTESIKLIVR